jgi:RNA polymerase sigma-70 factor (ECF subfamily)
VEQVLTMTEKELLGLLAEEETMEYGFRVLVNTYGDRLYEHILRMVNNREDTDDVLQNTLVKVYRGFSSFQGNSRLYTWLYRIATNEALSHLARQKRRFLILPKRTEDQAYLLDNKIAEPEMEGSYIQHQLQSAIALLPPKQRAVFSLRYFEEKSYQEMAVIFDTSVGALKASYHHAVKKIEAYLCK